MIDSDSVPGSIFENAVNGTALLKLELVAVFAELGPLAVALRPSAMAFCGGASTPEDGVKRAGVVVAFDPAVAEAEAEKEVLAAAPVAPEDALLWR